MHDGRTTRVLASVHTAWTDHLDGLTPERLHQPSRASAWTVEELLLHQHLDARRALVAAATPADGVPDVDAVSSWRGLGPDVGDDGSTLVLEATVHLLDAWSTPPHGAVDHTVRVLEGLRGRALGASGVEGVLRATGRLRSDEPDDPLPGWLRA